MNSRTALTLLYPKADQAKHFKSPLNERFEVMARADAKHPSFNSYQGSVTPSYLFGTAEFLTQVDLLRHLDIGVPGIGE